ncbi:MAG: chromophore lyase CpcT/CpeT [Acidobacteria bacterium]|nr:chromophore lyase CpcT/CpeT [Acidobacteriota bacterium]
MLLALLLYSYFSQDVAQAAEWLTGSFSSASQASKDASYFDIRLHVARIWSDRSDGIWLYVEQAEATKLDAPYRQRVYRLNDAEEGFIVSDVYTLMDAQAFIGGWQDPSLFDAINPDDLEPRVGCSVYLKKTPNGTYQGGTRGKECVSSLRGASYATSEIELTSKVLRSWDRGFDPHGNQVWGAETSAYEFERQE